MEIAYSIILEYYLAVKKQTRKQTNNINKDKNYKANGILLQTGQIKDAEEVFEKQNWSPFHLYAYSYACAF